MSSNPVFHEMSKLCAQTNEQLKKYEFLPKSTIATNFSQTNLCTQT